MAWRDAHLSTDKIVKQVSVDFHFKSVSLHLGFQVPAMTLRSPLFMPATKTPNLGDLETIHTLKART